MDRHAAAPFLGRRSGPCLICGSDDCTPAPTVDHLASYPFLPGGRDPMADQDYVITPHRIIDEELERVVYSPGAKVPIDDAIKYGLIDKPPKKAPAKKSARAKKGPAEDRAKRKSEDR